MSENVTKLMTNVTSESRGNSQLVAWLAWQHVAAIKDPCGHLTGLRNKSE